MRFNIFRLLLLILLLQSCKLFCQKIDIQPALMVTYNASMKLGENFTKKQDLFLLVTQKITILLERKII